jgi:antibiotic biosynthesis monooxygenase (ABM) superfamily enzyme
MVIQVIKWNIRPEKAEAYPEWVKSATGRLLAVPGVVELRAYRPATGTHQVVATYEFTDMQAWASWRYHEDIQKVIDEGYTYMKDISVELWGPSSIVPEPIRPGQ